MLYYQLRHRLFLLQSSRSSQSAVCVFHQKSSFFRDVRRVSRPLLCSVPVSISTNWPLLTSIYLICNMWACSLPIKRNSPIFVSLKDRSQIQAKSRLSVVPDSSCLSNLKERILINLRRVRVSIQRKTHRVPCQQTVSLHRIYYLDIPSKSRHCCKLQ